MRQCKVQGCERKFYGKDYCHKHYLENKKNGKIKTRGKLPVEQRLEKMSTIDRQTGCWMWTGTLDVNGYGLLAVVDASGKKTEKRAHRLSYEAYKGPIPEGFYVLHHCDTPACINPEHLFAGTGGDNIHDAMRKGRMGWQKKQ